MLCLWESNSIWIKQKGPIYARTPVFYMDITIQKGSKLEQVIPEEWNALCYVYEGEGYFGFERKKGTENSAIVLKAGDGDVLEVFTRDQEVKFLLLAGKPLNENVVSRGPFVLENQEDLMKTFEDYRQGKNGFENARTWRSKIQKFAEL